MSGAVPSWVKWHFDKWQADRGLRMCSLAARGLWIDMLTIMHDCDPYGHLIINGHQPTAKHLAAMVGMTTEREVASLLTELEQRGVFSRREDGTIYSRRQVRDNAFRVMGRANGSNGGNPILKKGVNSGVNPQANPSVNPSGRKLVKAQQETPSLPPPSLAPALSPPLTLPPTIPTTLPSTTLSPSAPDCVVIAPCERRTRGPAIPGPPGFDDRFWPLYPKKDDKGHARKAYEMALRKADEDVIVSGLEGYRFSDDPKFIPLASTWLNGERWLQATESDGINPTLKAAGVTQADLDVFMSDGSAEAFFGKRS